MTEPHIRDPFDDEHDDRSHGGRRRAPVADWGGDELFTRSPSRRRFVPQERPARPAPEDRVDEARADGLAPRPPIEADADADADVARGRLNVDAEAAALAAAPSRHVDAPSSPVGARRTVRIQGRPGEGAAATRRRPPRPAHERLGPRPERVAAWAVVLGLLLVLIAVATADAATAAAVALLLPRG